MVEQELPRGEKNTRPEPAMLVFVRDAVKAVSKRAYNQKIKDNLGSEDTIDGLGPKLIALGLSDEHIGLTAAGVLKLAEAAKKIDPETRGADAAIKWANSVPKKLESGEWLKEAANRIRRAESVGAERAEDSVVLSSEFSARTEPTHTAQRFFRKSYWD